jgi:hypothetical protein
MRRSLPLLDSPSLKRKHGLHVLAALSLDSALIGFIYRKAIFTWPEMAMPSAPNSCTVARLTTPLHLP